MSSLLTLSPDVLAEIVAFLKWKHLISLWKCGDQALNARLFCTETHSLVHEGGKNTLPISWPWALNRTPKLLSLRIKATGPRFYVVCPDIDLHSIPESLTRLDLRFYNAFYAFIPSFSLIQPNRILYNISEKLPNLKSLTIDAEEGLTKEFFGILPAGLTKLVLRSAQSRLASYAFLKTLPQDLKCLKLRFLITSFDAEMVFPPNLTELDIRAPLPLLLDRLPASLVSLEVSGEQGSLNIKTDLKRLPQGLKRLYLATQSILPYIAFQDLPPGLDTLGMFLLNSEILASLPKGLTRLAVPWVHVNHNQEHLLPRSLRFCHVITTATEQYFIKQLPRGIEHLEFDRIASFDWSTGHFSNLVNLRLPHLDARCLELPDTLTTLSVRGKPNPEPLSDEIVSNLLHRRLKRLTALELPSDILPLATPFFPLLPPSLTSLKFNKHDSPVRRRHKHELDLKKPWPCPNLKILHLPNWLFNTGSTNTLLSALTSLSSSTPKLKFLNIVGRIGSCKWTGEQVFSALPRSLRTLLIQAPICIADTDFKLLPRTLVVLQLFEQNNQSFKPEALKDLPQRLNTLSLPGLTSSAKPFLPPHIINTNIPNFIPTTARNTLIEGLCAKYG